MSDLWTEQAQPPRLDVRVVRFGTVVHHELCETESQAKDVSMEWGDIEGTTIEIIDLAASDPTTAMNEFELYDDDE